MIYVQYMSSLSLKNFEKYIINVDKMKLIYILTCYI